MAEKKKPLPPEVPPEAPPAPAGDPPPPPKYEAPAAADPAAGVPRELRPIERSPGGGLRRYKLRAANYHTRAAKYILARSADEAKAEYLRLTGLGKQLELLRRKGKEEPDPVEWAEAELPD